MSVIANLEPLPLFSLSKLSIFGLSSPTSLYLAYILDHMLIQGERFTVLTKDLCSILYVLLYELLLYAFYVYEEKYFQGYLSGV
ncbi:hypothetical protein F4680DRAFT_435749 [Xylaria scruposa]|nr:hypothetical protein F4680DRAFT_435749 [Xylaria scruposa]